MSGPVSTPAQAEAALEATTSSQAAPAAVAAPATTATPAATAPAEGAATPTGPPAAEPSSAPLDFNATMDAITEARMTGNVKEATRLQTALDAQKVKPAAAPAPEPEPPAAAAGDGETIRQGEGETEADPDDDTLAAGDQPQAGDNDDVIDPNKPPEKNPTRIRINHLSEEDQAAQVAINALTRGGKMSLKEATRRVLGEDAPAPAATAAGAEPDNNAALPDPEPVTTPQIEQLESTVQDLERQMDEAGAGEGLFTTEVSKLTKKLSKANADLAIARDAAQREAQEVQRETRTVQAQWKESETVVKTKFPDMANKESDLFKLARSLSLASQNPTHEDHGRGSQGNAPDYFASKAAKLLGIQPKGKAPATTANGKPAASAPAPAATPSPTAQPPAVRPASGAKGTGAPPPAKTSAQLRQEAEDRAEDGSTNPGQIRGKTVRMSGGMILGR